MIINPIPIPSMYGISTYIYHEHPPNVGKYTIHGWYGIVGVYIPIIRIPIKGGDDHSQHREVIDPGTCHSHVIPESAG